MSPKFCTKFCGGCIYLHRFTIPSKINTIELGSHGLLNVEMGTLLLLVLRFFHGIAKCHNFCSLRG